MSFDQELQKLNERAASWRERQNPDAQRRPEFRTPSQLPVEQLYTAADTAREDYMESVSLPGGVPLPARHPRFGLPGPPLGPSVCSPGSGRPQENQ